nr:unnamed protein product [Callosobruchus chinensis]
MSEVTGISRTSIQRILKHYKWHPYKIQLLHELNEDDHDRRLQFCNASRVQRRAFLLIGDLALTCHLHPLSHQHAVVIRTPVRSSSVNPGAKLDVFQHARLVQWIKLSPQKTN